MRSFRIPSLAAAWTVAAASASLLLGCATAPSQVENWWTLRTRHFEITSALDPDATRRLGADLELFRSGVEFLLGSQLESAPIRTRVFAFDGRSVTRPFALRGVPSYILPSADGLLLVLRTGGGWRRDASLETRLELARFFLRNREGLELPLWYDEGFGLFAGTLKVGDGSFEVGLPRLDFLTLLRKRLQLSIGHLIQIQDLVDLGMREREIFDAEAWALVHYLSFQTGNPSQARRRFDRYFSRVQRGSGYRTALEEAFGESPEALQKALSEYVRRRSFDAMQISAPSRLATAIDEPRPLPRARALPRLGWLAIQLERPGLARDHFQAALEIDPGSASALTGLAASARLEAKPGEARAAIQRALALYPDDALVQLEAGQVAATEALREPDPSRRKQLASQARDHYEASLRDLDTNPGAWARIGASYLIPGQNPERGVAPLERAQRLLPSSLEIELLRARVDAARGQASAARYLATSVASRTLSPTLGREARAFLEEIGGNLANAPAPTRQRAPSSKR